ncbi:immunoglobulin lambda-1 light chain-like [Notolabrus celidotus]|uniref:immunoglobulin lambda-1 light chain-like n=1 Tax=Notolabrus celidotus TaxID=1203425 RepID=UPI0014901749|nr:immunoglobulin lambda-1 light chain-like [Notolabrus celidotus]
MLLLPAAALCCLCSALLTMAAELIQEDLTLTRRVGEEVSFSCGRTDLCDGSYVFWYQKKDTETFRVILDISRSTGDIDRRYNHPQVDDFSGVKKQNSYELQIQRVELSHSATYYCSCGGRYYLIFGSGTKLFVTDEPVVKPVVSVYPAASRAQLEGKSSLLCVASDMFPPLVQISWERRKGDGQLEVLSPAEGEQLELRESGRTVSILIVPQRENITDRYLCSVQHERVRVAARTEQEVPAAAASCPPEREAPDLTAMQQTQLSFQAQCRVKLLSLLYSLLILKSLVYCCGLSLLRILTNKPPSVSCTCADRLSPAGLF